MNVTLDLETGPARLAAWMWLAALQPADNAPAETALGGILTVADPGPVTVEIVPLMEDTEAAWIKPGDEAVDLDGWLAVLPADRLALFHLCSKVMDEILAEAVAASPREHDGAWRAACPEYDHVSAPARDHWRLEIHYPDGRRSQLAVYDDEATAETAVASFDADPLVLESGGRVVRLSEIGASIVAHHVHRDAYEGEHCRRCGFHDVEHVRVSA